MLFLSTGAQASQDSTSVLVNQWRHLRYLDFNARLPNVHHFGSLDNTPSRAHPFARTV